MGLLVSRLRCMATIATLLLFTCLILTGTATATLQTPDHIIYNGVEASLFLGFYFPSPLEVYFADKPQYPFRTISTANYRGHIATWEIANEQLFLNRVDYEDSGIDSMRNIPLDKIFGLSKSIDRIKATWFTGLLRIMNNNMSSYAYVKIKEGKVTKYCEYASKNADCSRMEKEYEAYIGSFSEYEFDQLGDSDDTVLNPITQTQGEALAILQNLLGYKAALALFQIEQAHVVHVDYKPTALKTTLKPRDDEYSHITWNNPLVDGRTSFNWNDFTTGYNEVYRVIRNLSPTSELAIYFSGASLTQFDLKCESPPMPVFNYVEWHSHSTNNSDELERFIQEYREAVSLISQHSWLLDGRTNLSNYSINLSNEIDDADKQAWHRARLKGNPLHKVVLSDPFFTSMIIGKDDSRVLIIHSTFCENAPKDHILTQIGKLHSHLLASFGHFCPIIKYVVVEPSGHWYFRYYMSWLFWVLSIGSLVCLIIILFAWKKHLHHTHTNRRL